MNAPLHLVPGLGRLAVPLAGVFIIAMGYGIVLPVLPFVLARFPADRASEAIAWHTGLLTLAPGLHQAGGLEFLQMGAGQLDADFCGGGQLVDVLFPLAKNLDEIQALGAANGLADARHLLVQETLYFACRLHLSNNQNI